MISKDIFENTTIAFAAKTNAELHKAKFLFSLFGNNTLVSLGSSFTNLALAVGLPVSPIFKISIYNHFCGGETFNECKKTIKKLRESNVLSMLNYGVELKETEADFDRTMEKNLEALEFAGNNKDVKVLCVKITGFGRFGLFEKIQSKESITKEEKVEFEKVRKRFHKLCACAHKNKVQLYVDAEESWIQDPLDALVDEMMEEFNKEEAIVFNTFQFYRWDRLAYLEKRLVISQEKKFILGAKIVRGAYMEKERKRALDMGYTSPIHKNKKAVDEDFNTGMNLCLENLNNISVCIASQSEASNLLAIQKIDKLNIDRKHPHILFSQLYGMGDNITFNLAHLGFNACKYLPYGPVKDVIPYLIRRAQENTSVSGQMGRELKLVVAELKRRKS